MLPAWVAEPREDAMDTRAAIDSILDKAYAARRSQDAKAAAALFCDDGKFAANGAPRAEKHAERLGALEGMFAAFAVIGFEQHCRIIDPPRAVVHWRGKFRAQNGQVGETDILDLIEVRYGRIASLTSFFDTAYAAALSAPA
jgi:ketosteroid isomerase-like protein